MTVLCKEKHDKHILLEGLKGEREKCLDCDVQNSQAGTLYYPIAVVNIIDCFINLDFFYALCNEPDAENFQLLNGPFLLLFVIFRAIPPKLRFRNKEALSQHITCSTRRRRYG